MHLLKHLKLILQWNPFHLLLSYAVGISTGLIFTFLDPNSIIKLGLFFGSMLFVFRSMSLLSFTPWAAVDQDQFSWKYLQALPLDRRSLICLFIAGNFIYYSPLVVWVLSLQNFFVEEIFEFKDVSFVPLKILIWSSLAIAAVSLQSIKNLIQYPRLQFVRKNKGLLFLQSIRNWVIVLTGLGVLILLVDSLQPLKDVLLIGARFLRTHADVIFNEITFTLLAASLIPVLFEIVQRVWMHERVSYRKINWNSKRDSFVIAVPALLFVLTLEFSDMTPKEYQGLALNTAVYEDDLPVIKLLLKDGRDINKTNAFGISPLMVAAHRGNEKIFDFLLASGAKATDTLVMGNTNLEGMNILLLAIHAKNDRIAQKILDLGLSPKSMNTKLGYSALHLASLYCREKIVDRLLEKGADLHAKNKEGRTSLHNAARSTCYGVAVSLIEAGITIQLKDAKGKLPADYLKSSSADERLGYYLEKKSRSPASAEPVKKI